MTEVRVHALMKLAEYTLKMYADTQEPSDVAYMFGSLVETLDADNVISDEELVEAVDKVISDSENNT